MKKKLLALVLTLFSCCSLFAQGTITGETNPCPNLEYTYQITLPADQGAPFITSSVRRFQVVSVTFTQAGSNLIHKYILKWDNYYEVVGGSPVQQTFQLTNGKDLKTTYELKVTIKGLSDVQFSSVPSLTCAYRGNVTVSINPVANANRYVWSNDAGWIGNNNSPSNVFNVTNENAASVTVVAYNDNCSASSPVVSKTNSRTVSRVPVTATPAFTATSPTVLCPGTTATASVTVAEGSPIRYEWYALPAGYLNINGASYSSPDAPFSSGTTPSALLTYAGGSTGGKPVILYCRAVYSNTCKSEFGYYQINTGKPVVQMYSANTEKLGLVYGDSFGACPIEVLQLEPEINYNFSNVLEHQWEVIASGGATISNLTGIPLRVRMSSRLDAETRVRYRFRTSCGWSDWLECYMFTWDCSSAARTVQKTSASKTNATAATTGFSVSPNPASNEISVSLPTTHTGDLLLNVTDIKGTSLIRRKQAASTRFTVDISSLHAGHYIIQIQSGTNNYSKQFIVVK